MTPALSAAAAGTANARAKRSPKSRGSAVGMLRDPPDPAIRAGMQKDVILTPEGLLKLKEELEHLQTEKRREVAERIKEAREFGDISENSEYDDAKNEQAMLEQRIAQLEERLRSATVIDAKELSTDVVRVGSQVNVTDEGGKKQTFVIVGSAHADVEPGTDTDQRYRIAGRLAARRGQGKMAFLDLVDRSGRLQLQARVDELGEERMERLLHLDLGDLIGVDGAVFRSKRGELS